MDMLDATQLTWCTEHEIAYPNERQCPLCQPLKWALSEKEYEVLYTLAYAWSIFIDLPVVHPDHKDEFRRAIHEAERIIMIRPLRYRGMLVPSHESR
jgi:hypothetical protein